MLPVGRKRTKDLHLLPGVREIEGQWYWRPTKHRERVQRKKEGKPGSCTLGPARSKEALKKYGEVSGYIEVKETSGTVAEILGRFEREGLAKLPNGKPRSDSSKRDYKRDIKKVLLPRFGGCRYGKTEFEASQGKAIGVVNIQEWVAEDGRTRSNRALSAFSAAFAWAIRKGLTTYNPCIGVARNAEDPRAREAAPWEAEVLLAVATPLMALMGRFEDICGWRVSDIRRLQPAFVTAAGVRLRQGKRGKRQLWGWSDELRAIIDEAKLLPGPVPIKPEDRYIFHTRRGKMLSMSGFESMWQRTKKRANRLLATGIIDPDTLEVHAGLVIEDLHFHDWRSKAGDDAAEQGKDRAAFLGDSEATAERHYARRETRLTPNK